MYFLRLQERSTEKATKGQEFPKLTMYSSLKMRRNTEESAHITFNAYVFPPRTPLPSRPFPTLTYPPGWRSWVSASLWLFQTHDLWFTTESNAALKERADEIAKLHQSEKENLWSLGDLTLSLLSAFMSYPKWLLIYLPKVNKNNSDS